VAIVGGGYIGLEAAASVRALGGEALVIEREPRLLARVASQPIAEAFETYHRARGVQIVLSGEVAEFEGKAGAVRAVRLIDGRRFDCDLALVGVGSLPNDELALAAGIACENGIIVDHDARTSAPGVFAAGDATRRPLPFFEDRWWRLESVPNALEQAKQAAAAICGAPQPQPELPWFWSDQYDLKLQIAGLPFDVARTVVRGRPAERSFAVFQLDAQDRIRAVEAVNLPDAFMAGRQLIVGARTVDLAALADPAIKMKAILAAAR
jgi:3-phenylpropionate/trans-cinnamate dioxygenase ferredoxin reductase subunit